MSGEHTDGRVVLSSYNIHRCCGRDGNHRPDRVRDVLRQIDADVIALQEVETLHDEPGLLDYLCEGSRWNYVQGATMARVEGDYGNAILTSLPIQSVHKIDISQERREPRGALLVRLAYANRAIDLLATHLGLKPAERRAQTRLLLRELNEIKDGQERADCTVLMGDLNEWFLWGRPLRYLHRHFKPSPAPATYPAGFPLFALDRIWVNPRDSLVGVRTIKTPLARMASDHLPLVAELDSGWFSLEQAA